MYLFYLILRDVKHFGKYREHFRIKVVALKSVIPIKRKTRRRNIYKSKKA